MKNFEIIEEGRLSKSEIGKIVGGVMTCSTNYSRDDDYCKSASGLSSCPGVYTSCNSSGGTVCNTSGGYSGPAGPAGVVTC